MRVSDFTGNKIITADDFGISAGVDETIIELCRDKYLNAVSTFVTTERFRGSISKLIKTDVKIGLHLSLTFGYALTLHGKSLITDENGNFNRSFMQILFLSVYRRKQIGELLEKEIAAQLAELQKYVIPSHIDGHQHIHTIPLIFKIVQKLQEKNNIPRIRIINERFLRRNILNPKNALGTVKLAILRFLGFINGVKSATYFISIFRTCKMDSEFVQNYIIPDGYRSIEIMLHPGNTKADQGNESKEYRHLQSFYRNVERETAKQISSNRNHV